MATLHSFWLSSCSWRVRAALLHKGISFNEKSVDIVKTKSNLTEEFAKVNPMQKVPALKIDGITLVESMAILQYLEDTRPKPPLQPSDAFSKAIMREVCEIIVSGIQPLQNVGLRSHLPPESFSTFSETWVKKGFGALEQILSNSSKGNYCVGQNISMADLCLVPQVFNAVNRLNLDLTTYPTIDELYKNLLREEIIDKSHPNNLKTIDKSIKI